MKTFTISGPDTICVSDGFHTMDELYEHLSTLYITLCRTLSVNSRRVWKSKLHSDGSSYPGWFILGIDTQPGQQITYHLPINKWGLCDFARELSMAPPFDGHTSDNVLVRLAEL